MTEFRDPSEYERTELSSMLAEFHEVFEVSDRDVPGLPPSAAEDLRVSLLGEEYREYLEAVAAGDLVEIADALADMAYIIFGTARVYGIPLDAVLAEVHRTNMAKAPGGVITRRDDGKVLKPEGWTPPDIAGVLAAATPEVPTLSVPTCSLCHRERTLNDTFDYHPIQVITGAPLGWYSGDDGEVCPECMTKTLSGQL